MSAKRWRRTGYQRCAYCIGKNEMLTRPKWPGRYVLMPSNRWCMNMSPLLFATVHVSTASKRKSSLSPILLVTSLGIIDTAWFTSPEKTKGVDPQVNIEHVHIYFDGSSIRLRITRWLHKHFIYFLASWTVRIQEIRKKSRLVRCGTIGLIWIGRNRDVCVCVCVMYSRSILIAISQIKQCDFVFNSINGVTGN